MRFILMIAIAMVMAMTGVQSFGGTDVSSDTPDLDIGTLVSEGKELGTRAKATDDALKQLGDEDRKIQVDKTNLTNDESAYNKTYAAFHERCGGQFVQGQESKVASCKAEYEQDLQVFKQVQDKKSELRTKENDWKARKVKTDQQKANLALKLESWKHRMKAMAVTDDCLKTVAASAGSGDSYAATLRLVSGYQQCWDGAKSVRALQPSDMQGSPVFSSRPARTPEQAIEDYKNSGKPSATPTLKRGLDQGNGPPAPPSSGH
jgi:hypothetical protein